MFINFKLSYIIIYYAFKPHEMSEYFFVCKKCVEPKILCTHIVVCSINSLKMNAVQQRKEKRIMAMTTVHILWCWWVLTSASTQYTKAHQYDAKLKSKATEQCNNKPQYYMHIHVNYFFLQLDLNYVFNVMYSYQHYVQMFLKSFFGFTKFYTVMIFLLFAHMTKSTVCHLFI